MEPERLIKTIEEVRQQCRFARIAWRGLQNNLNGMDSESVFFYVHALLERSREVARMLFPANDGDAEKGKTLRQALKVADKSVLGTTDLAPFLDKTGERLDRWMDSLGHYSYVPMNIMPKGTMVDFRQDAFLRNLDPDTMEFSWLGQTIDLDNLVKALQAVENAIETWLRRHRSQRLS